MRFSMSPKTGGTILKIDHFGFGDDKWWADNFIGHCSGWAYFAMNIKSDIEFGVGLIIGILRALSVIEKRNFRDESSDSNGSHTFVDLPPIVTG